MTPDTISQTCPGRGQAQPAHTVFRESPKVWTPGSGERREETYPRESAYGPVRKAAGRGTDPLYAAVSCGTLGGGSVRLGASRVVWPVE